MHKNWNNIKLSNASIIRFGGIAPDRNMPTNFQYIRMIDSIRANGMEPVIQVPFDANRYTAAQAANIVNYLNVVKGKNIKYWIIANEPNLGYGYTTPGQIANYFKPFASAMKAVDPNILIVGPEIAWFDQSIIDGLTNPGGPHDITGKDAAGRYYLDVISFHTYPFNGSQTRSQVVSNLTSTNGLQDDLGHLNSRVAAANAFHNRTGTSKIKTAITEANINYQNNPSDNVSGLGANSFIGGQFVAEMMAVCLKQSVDFINIWSVIEGNTTESSIGYIDPVTNNKKPTFYHFKMMADNFKGNFANGTSNKTNVKAFGSKNSSEITVMVMNQELTGSYNYTVRLNTTAIAGSTALKINLDAGVAMEYNDVIPSQSTMLLTFNASGTLLKKTEYSLTTHALANLAPVTTVLVSTGVEDVVTTPVLGDNNGFDIKVFPNPSLGKFTIGLNKGNSDEKQYEIVIINVIGQEVYRKKTAFADNKQIIDLNGGFAAGAYIVRVRQGEAEITRKIILEK
ncbi:MAG: T9SS type A sorting domain-containing protein [Bacteroidetes bacterium]|nr:T9SS type A sorting domain-containing protein [Bacteroidota bacterium]